MTYRHLPRRLSLGLLLTVVLTSGIKADEPAARSALTPLKVVVAKYMSYAPLFVAQEEGYFVDEGLAVEFLHTNNTATALPALIEGDVDVLASAIMPGHINVVARGAEIRFVSDKGYNGASPCPYSGIVARRSLVESGKLRRPEDLRGMRISTERTSGSYYRIGVLLQQGGLTFADIERINVPVAAEIDAFSTGALDATTLSEPWVTRAILDGHALLWKATADYLPDFQFGFNLFGPSLLRQNRQAGEKYLAAYLRAVRLLHTEGKSPRILAIIGKHTRLDAATLSRACWPIFHGEGHILEKSLRDFQVWAFEQGLIDAVLPVDALVDRQFLDAVAKRQLGVAAR